MRHRVVQAEILDTLPVGDPAAVANRRDLRFLNRFMGNWTWIGRQLLSWRSAGPILEAGAGEGDLGRYLLRRRILGRGNPYTGLDLWSRPARWPTDWGWVQADLLAHRFDPAPAVFVSNLLLHQFEDEQLRVLGERLADIPVWIICEPLRVRWAVWGLALMRPFRLHRVSWHDGKVSIEGGFRGMELPRLLGADRPGRRFRLSRDPRGSYRLVSWLTG